MIDRHYGHLARDEREHAIRLLDMSGATIPPTSTPWTLRGRRTTSYRQPWQRKGRLSRQNVEGP
jgi:hypothetical protein